MNQKGGIMKKSIISKIVSIIFILMLIGGIVCLFFAPKLYDLTGASRVAFEQQGLYYKILFYVCYIICLAIIFILNRIFSFIYDSNPFETNVENYIKLLAVLFISLSLLVGLKSIFMPTVLSIVLTVLTLIISLCFYVVAEVFKVAEGYKKEIDFTV